MGLPKVLENMLSVAADDNILKSWNIYQEKDGFITFKIRFHSSENSINHDDDYNFRKKMPATVESRPAK